MRDKFWHWTARHLPRRLAYWCTIVVWAHATRVHPARSCPGLTVDTILRAWDMEVDTPTNTPTNTPPEEYWPTQDHGTPA